MNINLKDYKVLASSRILTMPAYTEFKIDTTKIEIYITKECENGISESSYMIDKTTSIVEIAISELSYRKNKINRFIPMITNLDEVTILNLISDKSFLNQGKYFDCVLYQKIK